MNVYFKICLALAVLLAYPFILTLFKPYGPCHEGMQCAGLGIFLVPTIILFFIVGISHKNDKDSLDVSQSKSFDIGRFMLLLIMGFSLLASFLYIAAFINTVGIDGFLP